MARPGGVAAHPGVVINNRQKVMATKRRWINTSLFPYGGVESGEGFEDYKPSLGLLPYRITRGVKLIERN